MDFHALTGMVFHPMFAATPTIDTTPMRLDTQARKLIANPDTRRSWVIFQLMLQGRTLADIARAAGVQRQSLYHVFGRNYPRMEIVLAEALGLRPQQLFPERYDAHGLPKRRRGVWRKHRNPYFHGGKDTPPEAGTDSQAKAAA